MAAEKIIAERQLARHGFSYTNRELELHTKFTSTDLNFITTNLNEYKLWFTNLIDQNSNKKIFSDHSFKLALARQWLRLLFYQIKKQHSFTSLFNKGELTYFKLLESFINSL